MTDSTGFEPSLAFDTNDPMFVYGAEIGALWVELQDLEEESEHILHCRNAEMCIRIAERLGLEHKAEIHDETWMTVLFWPSD